VRRYRTERRSPARATLLIVGGLIVGLAVLVFALVSLGGSSKGGSSASTTKSTSSSAESSPEQAGEEGAKTSSSSSKAAAAAVNPSETNVVVLNGTSTTGLAHRVSAELVQHGFSRATPLTGRPPGANQATVVEYAGGHKADAQGVAQALGIAQAQPMEGTVASRAGSATVVVIVGLDKAANVP
jgi:LytR cell envelope-related transcriptional attenuator